MLIDIPGVNLDFAVVTRVSLNRLDDLWNVPGVYVLVDVTDRDGRTVAYVGKAPGGLKTRLRQHVRERDDWRRALLVRRPYQGFNSAEVGWAEGRLYDVLNAASLISLGNSNRPSDETLAHWQRQQLEAIIPPVLAALRVLGLDPDTPDQQATPPKQPATSRNQYEGSLSDLLTAGLVKAGSSLHPTTPSYDAVAAVQADGSLTVGGQTFTSLSSAGKAVIGHNVNGWDFWGLPSGSGDLVPMGLLRARLSRQGDGDLEEALRIEPPVAPRVHSGPKPEQPPAHAGSVNLMALIRYGALSVGDVLVVRYKSTEYRATVTANGNLSMSGRDYPTPTAAAVAITGSSVNGWRFWKSPSGETLGSLRGRVGDTDGQR